jgi:hypothetical protein
MIKNVGLVGYGNFGKKTHKELTKYFKNKNIFILTKTKKKQNFNFYYNEKKFFEKKIDFYFICSPLKTHFYFLKKLLKKKKDFLIEKPIISNIKELNYLKKNLNLKKKVSVNYIDKFNPSFRIFLKNIHNKKNLNHIDIKINKYQDIYENVKLNFSNIHLLPFFDWLPHPIAMIFFIFKKKPTIENIKNKFIRKGNSIFQDLKIRFKVNNIIINLTFNNYNKKNIRKISAFYKNDILSYSSHTNNKNISVAYSNAIFKRINKKNNKIIFVFKNKNSNIFYSIKNNMKNRFKDTLKTNLEITELIFEIGKNILKK